MLGYAFILITQFQFPTGWNSTYAQHKAEIAKKSFNSQRDGILPFFGVFIAFVAIVFQFPTERIYTTSNVTNTEHSWRFKLHRSKFTRRKAVAPARRLEFQTPAEEIYIVLFYEYIAKSCMFQTPAEEIYTKRSSNGRGKHRVSNSSGGNLHRARNSIFLGYEYLKFIFLLLKFR